MCRRLSIRLFRALLIERYSSKPTISFLDVGTRTDTVVMEELGTGLTVHLPALQKALAKGVANRRQAVFGIVHLFLFIEQIHGSFIVGREHSSSRFYSFVVSRFSSSSGMTLSESFKSWV